MGFSEREPNFINAKQKAEDLLDKLYINNLPIPILDIAQSIGLSVFKAEFENNDVAGFLDVQKQFIYVNTFDSMERQRFTIAHEIGHWLLHKDEGLLQSNPESTIYYRKPIIDETESYEKEANFFAANLLVPLDLLKKYSHHPDSTIASLFVVSQQVIGYRRQCIRNKIL